jgi:hypothetical protein
MANFLRKVARWLFGLGLLIIGARHLPDASSTLEQRWWEVIPWPWLQANWIALACFVLAAVLFLYEPLKWWIDRQNAKEVRNRIRANLVPGTFPETDAYEALLYLLNESAWAWKRYAQDADWLHVNGPHLREFEKAARDGKVLTTGWDGFSGKVVPIDGRYWAQGRFDERTISLPQQVAMMIGPEHNRRIFSQIRVCTADLYWMWPKASRLRQWWSNVWVYLKIHVWYGSRFVNRMEERRQRAKVDRRLN